MRAFPPDLSIIIASHNRRELLARCLDSLTAELTRSILSVEVICVDNGSNSDTRKFLRGCQNRQTPYSFTIVFNRKNIGFARANNQGVSRSRGRYLLLLNEDTLVGKGTLEEMIRFFDRHPRVGVASCQLRNTDGSIQPQGGSLPRLSSVAVWALFLDDIPVLKQILPSYQLRRQSFFIGKPKLIGWVAGTAMWVRQEAWKALGGFEESLFMYGEDVDLCYRARKRGWQIMVNPAAGIVHLGRQSSTRPLWVTGEVGGLWHLFRSHKPRWELPLLRVILFAGMRARWFVFGILGRNEQLAEAYARASAMG